MHECSKHEGEARGLYVVTHECSIHTACGWGGLTGL